MLITITANEIMNKGVWEEVCELKGFNPWCVKEGLMDSSHKITLTDDQALQLGLISDLTDD